MLDAIEYLYQLSPEVLEDELDFDTELRKKKNPAAQRDVDKNDRTWLFSTTIGECVQQFCSANRMEWSDPNKDTADDDGKLSMKSDPLMFWKLQTSYSSIKPYAQAILALPGSAIKNERGWKKQNRNFTDARAMLGLEAGGDQTWLAELFDSCDTTKDMEDHPFNVLSFDKLWEAAGVNLK